MEDKIKEMGLSPEKESELIDIMKKQVSDSQSRAKTLKARLKARKERNARRPVKGIENLNDSEKSMTIAVSNLMTDADRTREDNALLAALRTLEEEDARNAQLSALKDALKGSSSEDRRRLVAQFEDDMFKMQSRLKDQKEAQRDELLAKLEAKRRMKEELAKEQIVKQEMNRLTVAEVRTNDLNVK